MKCPNCGSIRISVVDVRERSADNLTRRRRYCARCETRFTTYEGTLENILDALVVKKINASFHSMKAPVQLKFQRRDDKKNQY